MSKLDLNAIRNRLQSLQNQGQKTTNGPRKNNIWKPVVGKSQIRILPSAFEIFNEDAGEVAPFKELQLYYGIGEKVMISPSCFGKKDPIMEFVKQLRSSYNKEAYNLSRKLEPKMRVYVPVIVRGEEEEGVRLWNFGKQVYMELLSLLEDEDIGNFTDIVTGRDLTITVASAESTGTGYASTTVRPKLQSTPLSNDKTQLETWLKEQPNPMEVVKLLEFDDMKRILQQWLTPEEEEGSVSSEPAVEFDSGTSTTIPPTEWNKPSPFTLETQAPGKKVESKASLFESLFEEKDELDKE